MINIWDPQMMMRYILAVVFQMAKKNVGPGGRVIELEQKLAELCGKKYAVVTSSGTTALILAIMSLKMDRRKTILFPAYTNLAGANAAKLLGHKVRLVDIHGDTLCMDPEKMDLKGAGAVIFVNHNAYVGEDIQKARNKCDAYNIPMIEDSAQAIGLLGNKDYGPGSVGGFINTLSFSVPKLVTAGQGGAVLTDEEPIALLMKSMRDQGMDLRSDRSLRWHVRVGGNFRMTDLQAAYCLAQLRIINSLLARRKRVQDWYSERMPIYRFKHQPSVWLPIYRAKTAQSAQGIIDSLKERDIAAARLYLPVNMQKEFATKRKFESAAKASTQCVYLPGSLGLKENQVAMICEIVKGADED